MSVPSEITFLTKYVDMFLDWTRHDILFNFFNRLKLWNLERQSVGTMEHETCLASNSGHKSWRPNVKWKKIKMQKNASDVLKWLIQI